MLPTWKSALFTALKFAIPAGIIGLLLFWNRSRFDELWAQPKDHGLLVLALVVAVGAISLSFFRWAILVRCQGIEISVLEAFRLGAISFLLSFVSAGSVGGDLFKAVFLARRRPGKRIEAIASVFVDRGCGLYGLLLLVAAGLLMTDPPDVENQAISMPRVKQMTAALVVTGTVVLAVLVLGGRWVDRAITRWGTLPFLGTVIRRIGPPLRMFHAHPLAFLATILMSVGVQCLLVISVYLIAIGLYAEPPSLADHFVIVPIGMLASALPLTPGGVGVLEATFEVMYRIVPTKAAEVSGTVIALVFELVKVIIAILGTIFYWTANEEVRHSLEEAEEQSHASESPSGQDHAPAVTAEN